MGGGLAAALMRVAPFVVLLGVIAIRVRQGRISTSDLSWQRPQSLSMAAAWWLGFVALACGVEALLFFCGILDLGGFKHEGLSAAIRIIGMIALAPICEELLFRGLLLNWLVRKLSSFHVAAIAQAAAFVALHNFAYEGSLQSVIGIVQSLFDAMLFAYGCPFGSRVSNAENSPPRSAARNHKTTWHTNYSAAPSVLPAAHRA